eukprot:SAG25_NODE_491_length_7415_cov_6.908557_9_plen_88_part_00
MSTLRPCWRIFNDNRTMIYRPFCGRRRIVNSARMNTGLYLIISSWHVTGTLHPYFAAFTLSQIPCLLQGIGSNSHTRQERNLAFPSI